MSRPDVATIPSDSQPLQQHLLDDAEDAEAQHSPKHEIKTIPTMWHEALTYVLEEEQKSH